MTFATPELLWLLLAPVALLLWALARRLGTCPATPSSPAAVPSCAHSEPQIQVLSTRVLSWTVSGLAFAVIAVARPQIRQENFYLQSRGAPTVFALDLSVSMLAEDYTDGRVRFNRLQAIRPTIEEFIARHPQTPIGLVVFAASVRKLARPTLHHDFLLKTLAAVKIGMLVNGTAIGDGLNAALRALPEISRTPTPSLPRSSVILITDGVNNTGTLSPEQATARAVQAHVIVHTVALGSVGMVRFPTLDKAGNPNGYTFVESDFDPAQIAEMAGKTGGIFCRARGQQSINSALSEVAPAPATARVPNQSEVLLDFSSWGAALAFLNFVVPAGALLDLCFRSRRPPSR